MSLRERPKRRAAAKSIIIELSDSEDEPSFGKHSKLDDSYKVYEPRPYTVDNAAKPRGRLKKAEKSSSSSTGKNEKKPRAKKISNKEITENIAPILAKKVSNQEITENIAPNVDNPPEVFSDFHDSSALANTTVPAVAGRSSFWARRKVWNIHELLAETENIDNDAAKNIVQLFENENTIPFICRYRRDMINYLTPEKLRDIKSTYTEIVGLRKKAETIVTQLEKDNVINEEIREEMLCAKTTEDLEFLYAPYKPESKGSLAERAKALGLEVYSNRILYGESPVVCLESIIDRKNPSLNSLEKVRDGICNIISQAFSKHTSVLEELRRLQKVHRILLKSTKSKTNSALDKCDSSSSSHHRNTKNEQSKYEHYYDFEADIKYLKPHQVLAINRGEKSKFLTVKLIIPDYFKHDVKRYIFEMFLGEGIFYQLRVDLFEKSFEECYSKKLQPLLARRIRSDLNDAAKKASIDVFAKNLKQLLLMSPLKGERILGIDPGFANGCKLALVSETADVLETGVIYPHSRHGDPEKCGEMLAKMLIRQKCKIIALGNGTACRETEFWLSKLFEKGILDAEQVRYSIVSEQGASIYSCSEVAKKEFPNMNINEISAVSIARRLNDPLSEYVKIEPRHIGVGMYQHDVNEKRLTESLNEVVSECVSFVGVDINTASLSLLKNVAGLTEKRAEKIIQHRLENGSFRARKDLLQVKTIGEKTFVQCAGFIRIEPKSLGGEVKNMLDCTCVHPESYAVAKKIISKCKLRLEDIGNYDFITTIKQFSGTYNLDELASEFKIPKERVDVVLEALQHELFKDYRSDFDKKPLFKQGITRITDLSVGDVVSGAVTNITHFGAFVDIGVESDGLIHTSKMNGIILNIGDRVNTSVVNVDVSRRRIQLRLEEMIQIL